jgi:DNA-binding transcriptional LysR family regulator
MRNLASQLPPLKSLVAFEAAARHLSLTRAGEELRISREAVSRQIRVLEEHLGVKLFDRLHRAVALTSSGRKFERVVRKSLENIAGVTGEIRHPGESRKVSVSATIALASFWLTPRLADFRQQFPETEIHVSISDKPRDLAADEIDAGLSYGDGNWPGLKAHRLFDIHSFPVCSPEYLHNAPPLERAEDLLNHSLINLDGMTHTTEDWSRWLDEQNVAVPDSFTLLGFDSYDNVIQSALDGQGIALGFSGLLTRYLDQGQLLQPIEGSLTMGQAVFLVVPATIKTSPQVQQFIDWVLQQAAITQSEFISPA